MTAEEWRAGVERQCECGATFTAHWMSDRRCLTCVGRKAREAAARSRERNTKALAIRCACGSRLRLNGPAVCSECSRGKARVKKALGRIGFEIVPMRVLSGGGGPGTGKRR